MSADGVAAACSELKPGPSCVTTFGLQFQDEQ